MEVLRQTSPPAGPVEQGFDASMRRAMAVSLVVWQFVMLSAVLVTDTRVPVLALVVAHLVAAGASILVVANRLPILPVVASCYGLWCVDYLACDHFNGALLLAGTWFGNYLYAISGLLFRRSIAVALPMGGAVVIGAVLFVARPEWALDKSTALVVTAAAIVVAAQLAVRFLRGLAETADRESAASAELVLSRRASRRASREAAEDARLIHDTVINTLGAIANGVHAGDRLATVRARCRTDADEISALMIGRRDELIPSLHGIESDDWGLEIHRMGLAGDELLRQESLLTTEALRALHGATRELIRNAVKHSQATGVEVRIIRSGDHLEVMVADEGVGFDPGAAFGRGLERSVRARLAVVGGQVTIDSAPASGTRVHLRCPLATAAAPSPDADGTSPDADSAVDTIREHAAWLWSGAVLAVGVVIEAVNRPGQLTATYLMLGLVAACTLLIWVSTRRHPSLPPWIMAAVIATTVLAFVAGMSGVDYGRTDVIYYQALGVTPLLVLLVPFGGRLGPRLGVIALSLAATSTAVAMWSTSPNASATVMVGAAPALGIALGWLGFHSLVGTLVASAESERSMAAQSQLEMAARVEIVAARRRWRGASLSSSLALLEGLAGGNLDPTDPAVQRDCAAEEEHLRQLILLSPDAYRMNAWFARALAESRHRAVRFLVRGGEVDAPDDRTARVLGDLVVAAVATAAPGTSVVAGLFPAQESVRLVIVGAAGGLSALTPNIDASEWQLSYSVAGEQDVLELSPT